MASKVLTIVEKVPGDRFTSGGPTLEPGQVVYQYTGPTYGSLGRSEIAVTLVADETPFYGIPRDAVEELTHLWDIDANGNPTDYARCDIDGGVIATNSGRANCERCLNWADLEPEYDDADEQPPLDEPADWLDGERNES